MKPDTKWTDIASAANVPRQNDDNTDECLIELIGVSQPSLRPLAQTLVMSRMPEVLVFQEQWSSPRFLHGTSSGRAITQSPSLAGDGAKDTASTNEHDDQECGTVNLQDSQEVGSDRSRPDLLEEIQRRKQEG